MSKLFQSPDDGQQRFMRTRKQALEEKRRLQGPFLDAWTDPVANIKAFSQCMRLADIRGDGEHCLVVACADYKLRVFSNTSLLFERPLVDVPSALGVFYPDQTSGPSLAVASGVHIYIYRKLCPYYKLTLPALPVSQAEQKIWAGLKDDSLPLNQAITALHEERNNSKSGYGLTTRSLLLLGLRDAKEMQAYVDRTKLSDLVQLTVATCMESLSKSSTTADGSEVSGGGISMLVVGTESGHVHILSAEGTEVSQTFQLPSPPVFIATSGCLDVSYRIAVSCRNGNVYQIKNGKVLGNVIELETQPVGLVLQPKSIVVACLDKSVHAFRFKADKRLWSFRVDHRITNLAPFHIPRLKNMRGILLALGNGELRMYVEQYFTHTVQTKEPLTAMRFGAYGRESGALVYLTKSGAVSVKLLQRSAELKPQQQVGPPAEQDVVLDIPKKTKLYVMQTQREIEMASEMHASFQRELFKLRISTLRSYVKVITAGQGPLSSTGGGHLRLNARVKGVGPIFTISLTLKNTGREPTEDLPLVLKYNSHLYRVHSLVNTIPLLIPGALYVHEFKVFAIDPQAGAEPIHVLVCKPHSSVPLISAFVQMPLSELMQE